ncbi:hypothetical protein JJN93_02060 [Listeria monocytogenes]|nr:hypothetical protein [Listeria monocytogenes]
MKKILLICVFALCVFLSGCGGPELSIEEKQKEEYVININGKTDSNANVTMVDNAGKKSEVINTDGNFVLVIPRLASDATYQVTSEVDGEKKTTNVNVPKKKKLIKYFDFENQFNELSGRYSELHTKIPAIDSIENLSNGFSVSLDNENIMSIRLSYSESESNSSISCFNDYQDFILSVAAVNVILNRAIEGTDTIDFVKDAIDEGKDAKKNVNNIIYNVSNLDYMDTTITSVMIYPK